MNDGGGRAAGDESATKWAKRVRREQAERAMARVRELEAEAERLRAQLTARV